MVATFSVRNFGCRANQADGAALARLLAERGLRAAGDETAEWVIFNTCTVTAEADAEARRAIRALHRRRPEARIAVTGCYAERAAEEVAALPGVSVVAGHAAKWSLGERLVQIQTPTMTASMTRRMPTASLERSRPVIKVQEGCGRACSFCVIPSVRGGNQSRALGEVLAEAQTCAAEGHSEVVCSGINLGQWGQDLDAGLRLADLARAILERTAVRRLRLSSVEPMDWSEELTGLMAASGGRLARHAHLPLQSGSDAVLRRMHRRYRAGDYAARVEELARRVPGVAIGADVMAGFPGESETEFAATVALIERLPLAYLHVFPFSARPGTEAARRLAQGGWRSVPEMVIAARAQRLRTLGAAKHAAFLDALRGTPLSAVALEGGEALSDNYARIRLGAGARPGTMLEVRAGERRGEVLLAA